MQALPELSKAPESMMGVVVGPDKVILAGWIMSGAKCCTSEAGEVTQHATFLAMGNLQPGDEEHPPCMARMQR